MLQICEGFKIGVQYTEFLIYARIYNQIKIKFLIDMLKSTAQFHMVGKKFKIETC